MKSFIQFFFLFSIILAGLFVLSDGLCKIVCCPVDVDEKMDDLFKIPDFLMANVRSKLNANFIHIYGIYVMEIQNKNNRRHAVNLIFEEVAKEVTNLLEWFTSMVIKMIRLRDLTVSLEKFLEDIQSTVFNLNACLKHLYDNGANVAQALNRYLLFSDMIFVYRAQYGTTGFQKPKILDLVKKKTNRARLQAGVEDVPQKSYLDLLDEAKTKIVSYTDFYRQSYGCGWLNTDQLKWKSLIKSVTVQNLLSPISGKTLQQRYKETAPEVDSTKVMAFYVEVTETLAMVMAKNTSDIILLFVHYLRTMIVSSLLNNATRHERLKAVNVVLDDQIKVLNSFQRFMKSTLHLECPDQLFLEAAEALEPIVGVVYEVLENQVLKNDLPRIINVVTRLADHLHFSGTKRELDFAVTETGTIENLDKIIKDMRVASLTTTEIGRVMIIEK
ncbi:uncharacterized protein LOC126839557 [Adelges cooleyi]|uniref:uncharacterized protein LOC126839557 n=1 Tax=Adelges cooleyi TaxID=133065 RepID=UPI0021800F30|nr:uncharacterized protein LOC126839557 [Adelges cooleyi]